MGRWPLTLMFAALAIAQVRVGAVRRVESLSLADALPIITALQEVLPDELRAKSSGLQDADWTRWIAGEADRTRARLARGNEDSLVNFLLFGTSFTRARRIVSGDLTAPGAPPEVALRQRTEDLLRALSHPGGDERLLFLRAILEEQAFKVSDPAQAPRLSDYISGQLKRVLSETEKYSSELKSAVREGGANEEFIRRSTLFQDRGIALDTSVRPDFAVEEALQTLKAGGLLKAGSVRKAAVLGPGLDFTDKDAGYDLYPVQTTQPFALIDSLVRLGLASPTEIEITALDVSPRVVDHLSRARDRAARGTPYTLHLVRDARAPWKPEFNVYWNFLGTQVGRLVPPDKNAPELPSLQIRSVSIRPEVVRRVQPAELNIVTQHLVLPPADRFDLIIATNVLVYYGVFEQCLSLANIERMLRPGGVLVSNNALLELPDSKLHAVDDRTVVYSDRAADGDHMILFRRSTK